MGKLTIQEIAKILVEKNKLTVKEANQFAAVVFEVIQEGLDTEGQVKVKGLGTFKKIQVEARESVSVRTGERVMIDSHAKITFTPDALMKELVNKPFSQFETVILNDGVEFEDLADDLTEEELSELDSMENTEEEATQQVSKEQEVVPEETVATSAETTNTSAETETVVRPLMDIVDNTIEQEDEKPETEEEDDEDEENEEEEEGGSSWKKVVGYVLLTLLLMAASAYAGFWYGQQHATKDVDDATDVENVTDSIEVIEVDSADVLDVPSVEQPSVEKPAEEQSAVEKPQTKTEPEQAKQTEEPFWKKYEAMDARVRTGAYHIVGTDREVKVRAGETLSKISRRELGEGMSCYIEVYNGLKGNSELKEGQVIKIPKLKWKIKRSID
ncbi:MAG: HU family DNA-binding protein [Prevotella sp.]|nr:HU family DNA-binding protein [Prevotella sp.]